MLLSQNDYYSQTGKHECVFMNNEATQPKLIALKHENKASGNVKSTEKAKQSTKDSNDNLVYKKYNIGHFN